MASEQAPQMPQMTMSTGQQQTAVDVANTTGSLFGKATSLANSGMGELNKVTGELKQDANVWKEGAVGKIANLKGKMHQKKVELQQKADQIKAQHERNMAEATADLGPTGDNIHARFGKGIGVFKQGAKDAQDAYDDATKPGGKIDQAKAEFNRRKAEAEAKALQKFNTDPVNPVQTQEGSGRRRRRRKSRKKRKSRKRRKSRKKKRRRKTRKRRSRRKRGGHCGCAMSRKKSRRRRRR